MNNISFSKATDKEIKKFSHNEWKKQDIKHYGRPIKWVEKDFIFKATEKGKIIGCAKFKYESGVVYIKNVIIAENKRGKVSAESSWNKWKHSQKRCGLIKSICLREKAGAPAGFTKNWDIKKPLICLSIISKSTSLFIPKRFRKNDRNSFQ